MHQIGRAIDAKAVVDGVAGRLAVGGTVKIISAVEESQAAVVRVDDVPLHVAPWHIIANSDGARWRRYGASTSREQTKQRGQNEEQRIAHLPIIVADEPATLGWKSGWIRDCGPEHNRRRQAQECAPGICSQIGSGHAPEANHVQGNPICLCQPRRKAQSENVDQSPLQGRLCPENRK